MPDLRLCYLCPSHGPFFVRINVGDPRVKEKQCPTCGALSPRDYTHTFVIVDQ